MEKNLSYYIVNYSGYESLVKFLIKGLYNLKAFNFKSLIIFQQFINFEF